MIISIRSQQNTYFVQPGGNSVISIQLAVMFLSHTFKYFSLSSLDLKIESQNEFGSPVLHAEDVW